MERSTKDADKTSNESDDASSASFVEESQTNTDTPSKMEDEDPAVLEINNEFFNIADMKAFADEEEEFHMKMEDNNDGNSVSNNNSVEDISKKTTQPIQKYHTDDEIELGIAIRLI
mmetsp:Transcript_36860/g.44431  ORF Transcript_36860/g.44431 Transcript_36860/m.44431 type:complete len:116 (-) Transcript_36860:2-349(-)